MTSRPVDPKNEFGRVANAKPIAERFAAAIALAIDICSEAGMHTADMVPILEKELAWCRAPYQNPEDNEPAGS